MRIIYDTFNYNNIIEHHKCIRNNKRQKKIPGKKLSKGICNNIT